jgi:hypothetical protein
VTGGGEKVMANNQFAQQQTAVDWQRARPATPKRDEYANHIEVERREYDAVIRFSRRGENYGDVVTEITVPLGALEGLA